MLLEKPPTTNLADMDVLAAAEAASAGSVYVVFQHRHGSGARRAHQLLGSGALGTPQVAVCETLWYRPDSYFLPEWRGNWAGEGGGPTLGHGIHQIDLLLHLMGPWETVDARSARIARPVEFEDVSMALVTFAQWRGRHGRDQPALPARAQPDPDRHHRRHPRGQPRLRLPRRRLVLDAGAGCDRGGRPGPGSRVCPAPTAPARADRCRDDVWTASAGAGSAQQPHRPDRPAGRRPARRPSATTPPWPAPGRRWSSSPRSTRRPSSARPSRRRDLTPDRRLLPPPRRRAARRHRHRPAGCGTVMNDRHVDPPEKGSSP